MTGLWEGLYNFGCGGQVQVQEPFAHFWGGSGPLCVGLGFVWIGPDDDDDDEACLSDKLLSTAICSSSSSAR